VPITGSPSNIARDLKVPLNSRPVSCAARSPKDGLKASAADGNPVKRTYTEAEAELAELRAAELGTALGFTRPSVRIFGDGRSGTTWLSAHDIPQGQSCWGEPNVGALGNHYHVWANDGSGQESFIMGEPQGELPTYQGTVLAEARTRFLDQQNDYLSWGEPPARWGPGCRPLLEPHKSPGSSSDAALSPLTPPAAVSASFSMPRQGFAL